MENLINNYLFKALDAYPYNLEEAIEALNYALSYDDKNTEALCLMGRIYAETLKDYEKAKEYYVAALAENVNAFNIYPFYIDVLLWNEDFDEVTKLIDFALTVKGSDKAVLYLKKAILHEHKGKYKKALEVIKIAKKHTYDFSFMSDLDCNKDRIKGKLPKKKKKKKASTKS